MGNFSRPRAYCRCGRRLIVYSGACGRLEEIESASVDLVLTSPPYNIRHRYPGYSDCLPARRYHQVLKSMLYGGHRILKRGGLLAIDIAETISDGAGCWRAADFVVRECSAAGLALVGSWRYESIDFQYRFASTAMRGHSNLQEILVFSRDLNAAGLEMKRKHLDQRACFAPVYLFGVAGTDEASWPADLIEAFAEFFAIRRGQTVVDPFMGYGGLAKKVYRIGANFIGYEISADIVSDFRCP